MLPLDVDLFELWSCPQPWPSLECRAGGGEGHKGGKMSTYHTPLFHTIPYTVIPYHIIHRYFIPYHTSLFHTIPPRHIIPYQKSHVYTAIPGFLANWEADFWPNNTSKPDVAPWCYKWTNRRMDGIDEHEKVNWTKNRNINKNVPLTLGGGR